MKPKTMFILVGTVVFLSAVAMALLREVDREEAQLERAISGVAEVSEAMVSTGQADIARTDRLALLLIDPKTGEAVALKTVSPFVPPMAVAIGQKDVRGDFELQGSYYVMGITDKDGDIAKPTRGEVFGRSPEPIEIGQERVQILLDHPFRGQVPPLASESDRSMWEGRAAPRVPPPSSEAMQANFVRVADGNPCSGGNMIEGWVRAGVGSAGQAEPGERLVIRILVPGAPALARAFVYPEFRLPHRFRVAPSTNMAGRPPSAAYLVEAYTTTDPGLAEDSARLLARSESLIPLGSHGVQLELRPVLR